MSLFKLPTPQPPQPHEDYSKDREGGTLRALAEAKAAMEKLVRALSPFEPRQFTTADGQLVRGLVQVLGRQKGLAGTPTPFSIIDPTTPSPDQVMVQVNPYSYLRASPLAMSLLNIDDLNTGAADFAIAAGDHIWLQIDTSDDTSATSASLKHGTPPYTASQKFITTAGSGTTEDPYIWDQSFLPIAQVFDCSSGVPAYGGKMFSAGGVTLEVVQITSTHLSMRALIHYSVYCQYPFPSVGTIF